MTSPKTIKTDLLGMLAVQSVVVFYDYPLCFVCTDIFGTKYLFDENKNDDDVYEWKAVRVTDRRLRSLHEDKLSLEDCFRHPELKPVFLVSVHGGDDTAKVVELESFTPESIPESNLFVKSLWGENDINESFDLIRLAKEGNSTYMDVCLSDDPTVHSVPAIQFYGIIKRIKNFFDSFGDNLFGESVMLSPITNSLILRFDFNDSESIGSLVPNPNEVTAAMAAQSLSKVLKADSPETIVAAAMPKDNEKLINNYKGIIKAANSLPYGIKITTATPSSTDGVTSLSLSKQDLLERAQIIDTTLKRTPKKKPIIVIY